MKKKIHGKTRVMITPVWYYKYKKRRIAKKHYPNGVSRGIKARFKESLVIHKELTSINLYFPYIASYPIMYALREELSKILSIRQEDEVITICDETGYIKLSIGKKIMYKTTNLTIKIGNRVYAICYDDCLRQYVTIYQFSKEANNEYPACIYITKDKVSYFNDLGTEFSKNMFGEEKDMINVSIAYNKLDKHNQRLYAEVDRENNVLVDCYDNEIRHIYGLVHMFKGATVL